MDMNEIKEIFFQECEEQLAELESGLLKLNDGDRDPETVNAVFRAVHSIKGGAGAFGLEPLVRFADIEVDIPARRIVRGNDELHLTPIEFRLLVVLLNNPGKVLTQRQLLNQVWGPNAVEHSHYLRIYMGHLRQKLEVDPARPQHLLTETGIGYRFMP